MKFGIIKERKIPHERRTVLTPEKVAFMKKNFPEITVKIESSDNRIFTDEQYAEFDIEVSQDMTDCDLLIGVKEVPVEALLSNKKYIFFSHTIKKQPFNRKMLQAILEKNIDLYDHEMIVDANNKRLVGFGRYAGIVGTYNGIRAFGIKFDLFKMPKAETLGSREGLIAQLKRMMLPPIKIVLTGNGKVAGGVKEILDVMKIKQVTPENFLTKIYASAVYTQIGVADYIIRKDGKTFDKLDFYTHPIEYESNFGKYSKVADVFMAGHFYGNDSPVILTKEMVKSKDCTIKVVADISCDINGSVATTIRASTIADPLYGYHPQEEKEVDIFHPVAIVVMAVDNLPCEIPKDASEGFADMFVKNVLPAFLNNDEDGILKRSKITENGRLTERFKYLQNYVDGK